MLVCVINSLVMDNFTSYIHMAVINLNNLCSVIHIFASSALVTLYKNEFLKEYLN